MAKIKMLSDDLIGKIAAGEVVERPAAAIKELVENSLDAGAKRISVEIGTGGLDSFRVTDDGCGIDENDIRMAFERHATSKIRSADDLNAIGTLGFRGEALASIAAVGRVTMTTRTRDRETGIRVKNEGGKITGLSEAACAPGTSILVNDLFFNVPVRRQFMKKPMTEANAVTELMTRLVLSRPDVSFRYVSDGKTIFHSAGDGQIESAVLAVYGSHAARSMRKVDGHENGIVIRGFVGIGENARNNRGGENFFINGRTLRSPLLSGCLEDACRERVMIGKFPVCVLYLEMPYESVNVNVHPNKMEVRFRSDQSVREAVFHLVKESLEDRDAFERPVEMPLSSPEHADMIPEIRAVTREEHPESLPKPEVEVTDRVPEIRMQEEIPRPVYRPIEGRRQNPPGEHTEPLGTTLPLPMIHRTEDRPVPDIPACGFSGKNAESRGPEKEHGTSEPEQISALPEDLPEPMKVFGALFNTFILIEYADHLLMVDQHAVHERLLFDRMMKACADQRAGQEMLVPYIVSVTPAEMSLLEENRDLLEGIGLTAEPFSGHEVAIRSVPVTLRQHEADAFLHEVLDELENGRSPGADRIRAAILQTACKHAVKGGEQLTEDILRSLVEEMIEKKAAPTCPHGRPLVVSISHTELDRKFKRIQS